MTQVSTTTDQTSEIANLLNKCAITAISQSIKISEKDVLNILKNYGPHEIKTQVNNNDFIDTSIFDFIGANYNCGFSIWIPVGNNMKVYWTTSSNLPKYYSQDPNYILYDIYITYIVSQKESFDDVLFAMLINGPFKTHRNLHYICKLSIPEPTNIIPIPDIWLEK